MGSKIKMSFIQITIKNILHAVMVVNGCVDDKFSKSINSYLGEDAVYNFINSMIKESEYCNDLMKRHFNKELVMTKKDDEYFENSTKCCICDNDCIDGEIKVTDRLVRNLGKDDFKYLREECDFKVLYLVEQMGFYPFEYISGFENF